MKVLFIETDCFRVKTLDIPKENFLKECYRLIGCDLVTTAGADRKTNDTVWVDDEGLLKPQAAFFRTPFYPEPLAGRAIVAGCDDEGDSCDVKISKEELEKQIEFYMLLGRSLVRVPIE